ncbi:hypothetical protein F2Q70_00003326 [Brassica cretica]|uniref:Uncharacterized protein n=1 Tax=Brassica cretica TaxID=69181 RepID=A0A8S9IL33_BRACR|nr:hypothetical protein F2Q70_00003326 [Brassica cretica]
MDLSPDDFEGLWSTRKTSIDYSHRMAPKRHMSIIQGHTSNAKGWFERFFYVQIDGASVEENCLPLFCGKWSFHHGTMVGNLTGSGMQWRSTDREASSDLYVHWIWTSHTLTLFPIRGRELGPERTREGSRLINGGMRVFNSTLNGSFREARLSHFKAEEIERKFIRFQNEVAEKERRQAESHSRALIRAERKGRRAIAAELARRATLFDAEFRRSEMLVSVIRAVNEVFRASSRSLSISGAALVAW